MCVSSNNMLYPKEDRDNKRLIYECAFCNHTEPADDPCVSRTIIKHTAEYVMWRWGPGSLGTRCEQRTQPD